MRDLIKLRVKEIWEQVLEKENLPEDDTFFELGGNSLLSLALLDEMNKSFSGVELTAVELFSYPTIKGLSGFIFENGGKVNE